MKNLDPYNPELYISKNENELIKAVKLLEKKQTLFNPNILYIGKSSNIPEDLPNNFVINILCVSNSYVSKKHTKSKNLNLIVVNNNVDVTTLFNELQDLFLKEQQFDFCSSTLLNSLILCSDLQQIIDKAYEIIGNPILVLDASFKILVYTKNFASHDPCWNESILLGYFTSESINRIKKTKGFEALEVNTTPVIFNIKELNRNYDFGIPVYMGDDYGYINYTRMVEKIVINQKIIGYVSLVEENQLFKKEDIKLLSLLSNVLSLEMQKNRFNNHTNGIVHEHFIADLLDGKISDSNLIRERINSLNLDWNNNLFYVVVIGTKASDVKNTCFNYLRYILENIFNGIVSILYNDTLVFVIGSKKEKKFFDSNIKELEILLQQNNLFCGISRCFKNIQDIKKYYRQSAVSIKVGPRVNDKKCIFKYEDYIIYDVINLCSSHVDLIDYCHSSLLNLLEYDKENKTSYTQTLYTFIFNKKHASSANALHIHRNTMIYRISKIQEIMNIDLNDSDVLLNLHFSFKVLEYLSYEI
jgi:sugar diacid utilization regulator